MAKSKSIGGNQKMSFGKKKSQPTGKKSYGPKEQRPKKYVGQGR
jgi:hypothetical protein